MEHRVFWVKGSWLGKLGILPRPRGGDWLEEEVDFWQRARFDLVVSLLEPCEAAELSLELEAAAAAHRGIGFRSFPIRDRGIPDSPESVASLSDEILADLARGQNVVVHCRQGIGRSALVVAAILVSGGDDVETALGKIRESRGLEVPETREQRRWISEFASASTPGSTESTSRRSV